MNIGTFLGYGSTILTPWMRRQADYGIFPFEVVDNPDGASVVIDLVQKNSEDYGSGTGTGTTLSITSGVDEYVSSSLKEMVRFSISVGPPEASPTGTGVIFRMLDPTWYNQAHV